MILSCFTLLSFSGILSVTSDISISDYEYQQLPAIFHIDNHSQCMEHENHFCRTQLQLFPEKHDSTIWSLIKKMKKSNRFYNHDELHHAICISKDVNTEEKQPLTSAIEEIYNEKYKNKGVKVAVLDAKCSSHKYETRWFDITFLCITLFYIFMVFTATYFHYKNWRIKNVKYEFFSLFYNLEKLNESVEKQRHEKLKCIQGIRVYTAVLIIFCHTFCSFAGGFVENTKYLEDIPLNIIRHCIRNWMVFLVQTFFLVSAWFLSYGTFKTFQANKNLEFFKYTSLTLLNRYLRIIPPLVFVVFLNTSVWIHGYISGPIKSISSEAEFLRCQKTWWVNFLLLSNHYRQNETCYLTAWYLSADFQLYVLSAILLIITLKFKHKLKLLILWLCLGIVIPGVITYIYNLDIIFRLSPQNAIHDTFLTFHYMITYTSSHVNMASYMLGLIFGYIYFKLENKTVIITKPMVIFWWPTFLGLPLLVLILSCYEYSGIWAAILSGILKPLYALGIGIGIFGMSLGLGGVITKMCTWKPLLYLGNFSYATYVVHFAIVFYRTAATPTPFYVSDSVLLLSLLQDASLSFFCGMLLHLMLEMPISNIRLVLMSRLKEKYYKKSENYNK